MTTFHVPCALLACDMQQWGVIVITAQVTRRAEMGFWFHRHLDIPSLTSQRDVEVPPWGVGGGWVLLHASIELLYMCWVMLACMEICTLANVPSDLPTPAGAWCLRSPSFCDISPAWTILLILLLEAEPSPACPDTSIHNYTFTLKL